MCRKEVNAVFMRRCLELAALGRGRVSPNPMVGSVIVHQGRVIGEGFHKAFGKDHAEVVAIESVRNREQLRESTMYVNLEPCAHRGKTPPCSERIVQEGIPRVVIGTPDPNVMVSGKGARRIRKAGFSAGFGLLENDCIELNIRFFTFHILQRPYVILKWAQTKDGFVDIARDQRSETAPAWITDEVCRSLVHKWRTEEDGILVGTNTAMKDDPQLTARSWAGQNPVKVVIDMTGKLPANLRLFDHAARTILITSPASRGLAGSGLPEHVEVIQTKGKDPPSVEILSALHGKQIQSVIIEGGPKILKTFYQSGCWDEARVFTGERTFIRGVRAPDFPAPVKGRFSIGSSQLAISRNPDTANIIRDRIRQLAREW